MKMLKMLGGVLMISTLVYAGGDFQVVTEVDREEDAYIEPTVESYNDSILVEEEPMLITSSRNLWNAMNVYNNREKINQQVRVISDSSSDKVSTTSSAVPLSVGTKNGFYAGLGITTLNYDIKCDCSDNSAKDKAFGTVSKIGYNHNKFIGIEARAMNVDLKNGMGSVKHVGLFLKPMLPLGEIANAYSLVGIAKTKSSGKTRKVSTKNLALGVGLEFRAGKGVGGFVDYERLVVKSGAPVLDTLSTGITFGF